ncbi:MAG: glycosyl hydrolase family 65 protein [Armatimonadota bacterium]
MNSRFLQIWFVVTAVFLMAGTCLGEGSVQPVMGDMSQGIPTDFPRFYFLGHEKQAQLLDHYYWYHFSNRLGNSRLVFNKEYLTTADMWAAGAVDKARKQSIQDVHRQDLSDTWIDKEGYVNTHQGLSYAHEHGWPFPLWVQSSQYLEWTPGNTAGWHFQEDASASGFDNMATWNCLKTWKDQSYHGQRAVDKWETSNARSLGIVDNKWQLESTGASPAIITPKGAEIEAFQAPFVQLRWTRTAASPNHSLPYVEWLREGDTQFGEDRRVYFDTPGEEREPQTGVRHSLIEMYRHPKWIGKIKRIRISLAPGESDVKFAIDSFFTVYDTRQTINNPIFILSSWNYFRWTGDIEFLRNNIDRMRTALRYMQTELGGLKYNHIRNQWSGHDGLSGFVTNPDGTKTVNGGHGIGSNYFDILPFGWDDMYATNQYYAATLAMAEVEEGILANPGWGVLRGVLALDPVMLRKHASEVKKTANKLFWDNEKGRFFACIDKNGQSHDYGFTFLNLDSIWYGVANDKHAEGIMDWISGKRIVAGDTSTGADIYHWQFGPRCTTKRNGDWCYQGWYIADTIPWGGQVQDGGAVLGFEFYDLWARLNVYGPDDAWQRLCEILKWEEDVWAAGGYREYYKDGKRGTTLQGGGTAGGIGVDFEFYESVLIPSIVTYGFLGLNPGANELRIDPKLPKACSEIGISNILYHNTKLDIKAKDNLIAIRLNDDPASPIRIAVRGKWKLSGSGEARSNFEITSKGNYQFEKN